MHGHPQLSGVVLLLLCSTDLDVEGGLATSGESLYRISSMISCQCIHCETLFYPIRQMKLLLQFLESYPKEERDLVVIWVQIVTHVWASSTM
jgi:hypothetical protein